MNGKRAKNFRFIAYGFARHAGEHEQNDPRHREYITDKKGTRRNTGARKRYQQLKKMYKRWVRDGRPKKQKTQPLQPIS